VYIIPVIRKEIWLRADSDIYSTLVDLILEAKKEIIILSPWIELTGHQEDLIKNAVKKDINVTLLARKPTAQKQSEAIEKLQQIGAQVFFDNRLHAKMILIDRTVALISSSNIIPTSMTENHELGILTLNEEVLEDLLGYLTYLQRTLGCPILKRTDDRFAPIGKKVLSFVNKLIKRQKAEVGNETTEICPECKKPLVIREGKQGRFWGCTGFPSCRFTRNIEWKS